MKSYWIGVFAFTMLFFNSCDSNDDATVIAVDFESPAFLVGNWKMVGSYISPAAGLYFVENPDGELLKFTNDGKFTTSRYPKCSQGTYTIDGNKLTFVYNCAAFNEEWPDLNGKFVYSISNESGFLLLSPITRMCVEGCSDKYQKVSN